MAMAKKSPGQDAAENEYEAYADRIRDTATAERFERPDTFTPSTVADYDVGAHSSTIASNAGRTAQSTDQQNQY